MPSNNLPKIWRGDGPDYSGYYFEGSSIPGDFHTHPLLPPCFKYFSVATDKDSLSVDPIIAANLLNSQVISPSEADWKTFLQREFGGIICYLGKDVMAINCLHNLGRNKFRQLPAYRLKEDKLVRLPRRVSSKHVGVLFDVVEFYRQVYEPVIVNSGTAEFVVESEEGTVKTETINDFRIVSKPGKGFIGYLPISKDLHGNPIHSPIFSYCAGI